MISCSVLGSRSIREVMSVVTDEGNSTSDSGLARTHWSSSTESTPSSRIVSANSITQKGTPSVFCRISLGMAGGTYKQARPARAQLSS